MEKVEKPFITIIHNFMNFWGGNKTINLFFLRKFFEYLIHVSLFIINNIVLEDLGQRIELFHLRKFYSNTLPQAKKGISKNLKAFLQYLIWLSGFRVIDFEKWKILSCQIVFNSITPQHWITYCSLWNLTKSVLKVLKIDEMDSLKLN